MYVPQLTTHTRVSASSHVYVHFLSRPVRACACSVAPTHAPYVSHTSHSCVTLCHTHITGRETLYEEELDDDEVEEELAPLTVQLAYALSRQGKHAETQELYDTVRVG